MNVVFWLLHYSEGPLFFQGHTPDSSIARCITAKDDFAQYPFISMPKEKGASFSQLNHYLLGISFKTQMFEKIKKLDGNLLTDFGKDKVESYVNSLLCWYGNTFFNEEIIIKNFGKNKGSIDFLLLDGGVNVLIECKTGSLPDMDFVDNSACFIKRRLEQHVMKGVDQGLRAARKIVDQGSFENKKISGNQNVLLIVTYTEHYLPVGNSFFDFLAVSDYSNMDAEDSPLKKENVYTISLSVFEGLMMAAQKGGSILSCLNELKKKGHSPRFDSPSFIADAGKAWVGELEKEFLEKCGE